MTREKIGLLLNEAGGLLTKETEKQLKFSHFESYASL